MKLNRTIVACAISVVILSACTSTPEKDPSLVDASSQNQDGSLSTTGYTGGGNINGEPLGANGESTNGLNNEEGLVDGLNLGTEFQDPANPLSKRTIYFNYDSSQVQQEFIPVIAAHAQYLLHHPNQRVILGGHADERGSREYNIALGEQRAKSVYRMMTVHGINNKQLEVVSYGEEKPAATGMDEAAWQLNRRVEITYLGQ